MRVNGERESIFHGHGYGEEAINRVGSLVEEVRQFDEEDQMIFREASLGVEVQRFLETEVGQHLLARAHLARRQAVEQLESALEGVGSFTPETALQLLVRFDRDARAPRQLLAWLADALAVGITAELQAAERDATENG